MKFRRQRGSDLLREYGSEQERASLLQTAKLPAECQWSLCDLVSRAHVLAGVY
jgi:hypothetical protein